MSPVFEAEVDSKPLSDRSDMAVEDLQRLSEEKDYELHDGQLVERNMGNEASETALNLGALINLFCRKHRLGRVCGADGGFIVLRDGKESLRRPDISFFKRGRLPPGQGWATGYERIPPDLAVEVLSPNDLVYEVDAKLEEYLRLGVRLIWVVHPATRIVTVIRLDGTTSRLHATDELQGEDVLPGFACSVAEIFEVAPAD